MAEARADDGPYVGPRPFEPADRERFYGRGEEARELASLVVAHRVVLLYAASGAGKTSLLNAGAIPLLEAEDGFEVLPTVRLRGLADAAAPGNPFIANLLSNLQRETGDDGPEPATLPGFLAGRPHPEASDALPAPRALVIDQFEELFTLYPERWAQRGEVFDQLGEALDQDPLLRVVLAIREDFIAQLDPYAARLPTRLRTRMRLEALRRPAALAAIALPLSGESRSFAPGVTERLVDDLLKVRIHTLRDESVEVPGELVEPVQLQVVCRTLWSSLPPDVREIGEAELARIGSVSDVLSNYYDEAVRAAAAAGGIAEPELRERLEAAFVTPVGTRGTVVGTGERVAGMPQPAIAELESRHLVRAEWRAGARWFELTHDSLIRPIVTSNAALRRRSQRRRERRLKRAVAGLVVVVAGMLGGLLLLGRDEAPRAKGRQVGVVDAHAPLAGLKLVREVSASGVPVAMTTTAGGHGLLVGSGDGRIRVWDLSVGREIATLDYGDTGLSSLDVDRSGTQVVAAGRIGLRRWTTDGPGTQPPEDVRFERKDQGDDVPALNAKIITAAAFGPTRGAAPGGAVAVPAPGPAGASYAAAAPAAAAPAYPVAVAAPLPASASSGLAVIEDGDGLIDTASAGVRKPLFTGKVVRVGFSPAWTAALGIGVDGKVRVRDLRPSRHDPPKPVGVERILRAAGSRIVSAAFAPDGGMIVTASSDGVARLWRTRDARLVHALPRGSAPLADARSSPDGRLVATAGADGILRVWTDAGQPVAVVRASLRPLSAVAWGAAGQLLVTTGADSAVRVWANVAPQRPLPARICSQADFLLNAVSTADAAIANDGTRHVASISCPARAKDVLRAPEAGTLATACGPRAGRRQQVALRTPAGRCWVFSGVTRRAVSGQVDTGAAIGDVPRGAGRAVRIELWESARGGRRLANLWNPMLFLDVHAAPPVIAYPGDQASPDQIAKWMAANAQAVSLPPELPVVAALVESGLHNLSYGERDWVGLFQMSVGIWNAGAYAGFPERPDLQLKWFTDQAKDVRRQALDRGWDPLKHPDCFGAWAADVIREIPRYRGRFQVRLPEARRLLGLPPGRAPSQASCDHLAATAGRSRPEVGGSPPAPPRSP